MPHTNLSRTTFWQLSTKGKPTRNWVKEMGYKLVKGKPVKLEEPEKHNDGKRGEA